MYSLDASRCTVSIPKSSRNACMWPRSGALSRTYAIPEISDGMVSASFAVSRRSCVSGQCAEDAPVELLDRVLLADELLLVREPDRRLDRGAHVGEPGGLQ